MTLIFSSCFQRAFIYHARKSALVKSKPQIVQYVPSLFSIKGGLEPERMKERERNKTENRALVFFFSLLLCSSALQRLRKERDRVREGK